MKWSLQVTLPAPDISGSGLWNHLLECLVEEFEEQLETDISWYVLNLPNLILLLTMKMEFSKDKFKRQPSSHSHSMLSCKAYTIFRYSPQSFRHSSYRWVGNFHHWRGLSPQIPYSPRIIGEKRKNGKKVWKENQDGGVGTHCASSQNQNWQKTKQQGSPTPNR